MLHQLKRVLSLMTVGLAFILFGANQSCDIVVDDNSSCNSCDNSYDEADDAAEDELLVSGSGEVLNLEYNNLVFPAQINWDSGLYYFAPDPEGTITGDRIVCATSIDDNEIEGDCFRSGHVCHFNYWRDSWTSVDDKDAYYLGTTSCKEGGEVGPFLVPLESPICGQDPFPACPTDDLFPTGPADEETDDVNQGPETAPAENTDDNPGDPHGDENGNN